MNKFSYGNPKVKFSKHNMYVDFVDNLHDLTDYEHELDRRRVPWAVHVVKTAEGYKFALVALEDT